MDTCGPQEEQNPFEEQEDLSNKSNLENQPGSSNSNNLEHDNCQKICQNGMHVWHYDKCMICTVCNECTGYSISCLSSMRPDRQPGQ